MELQALIDRSKRFRIGACEVDPARNAVARGTAEVSLEPKVMAVLLALAERHGEVVTRHELVDSIWVREYGGDESLTRAVSLLRKALNDRIAIETIPKRGYRLVAEISAVTPRKETLSSPPGVETPAADSDVPPEPEAGLVDAKRPVDPATPANFIEELKRRSVIREAIAYVVAAVLMIELVDMVSSAFDLPGWLLQGTIALLGLGFIPAMLLAWAYEVTPQGLQRESSALDGGREKRKRRLTLATVAMLAGIALLYFLPDWSSWSTQDPPGLASNGPSIALLPFEAASDGEDAALMADGMHGDLITRLSRIQGLKIISRSSVAEFTHGADNPASIGDRLGVSSLLTGRLWISGDEVRLAVQLLDLTSDAYLWAETYDRELNAGSVFALQSDITGEISRALHVQLAPESIGAGKPLPTDNIEAYRDYVAADRRGLTNELRVQLLESAVARDPEFALAWVRLANVYQFMHWWKHGPEDAKARSLAAIERAEAISPELPEIQLVRGWQAYHLFLDFDEALERLERARVKMPGNAEVLEVKATVLRYLERYDEAIADYQAAVRLDPLSEGIRQELALTYAMTRQFDKARTLYENGLSLFPELFVVTLKQLEELDWLEFGDPNGYLEVLLRPDWDTRFGDGPDHNFSIAMLAWRAGDLERAMQYSADLTGGRAIPQHMKYWLRGHLLRDAGQEAKAFETFERGVALVSERLEAEPEDAQLLLERAWLDAALGADARALEHADQALRLFKAPAAQSRYYSLDFQIGHAQLLCAAGALERAETAFREILSGLNPYTLASLVNGQVPCRRRFAGSVQQQRLQAEFGHLSSRTPQSEREIVIP